MSIPPGGMGDAGELAGVTAIDDAARAARTTAQVAPSSSGRMSNLRAWLPLIGLAVLGWVLSRLDVSAIVQALSRVAPSALALACGCFVLNIWLKVWRWQRLLRAQAIDLPHRVALPAFLSAQFYAQVTVGRVGEFLRMEALTERGVGVGTALAACIFDRLLDVLWVLLTGIGLGALWLGNLRATLAAAVVMLALCAGAALALRMFGSAQPPRFIERLAGYRFTAPVIRFARELAQGVQPMLQPRFLIEAMLWTVVAWYFYFAALFVLAQEVHIDVSRILLTATAAFAALTSLLPVTISGLGARELIYIEVLRGRGIASESAVALSFLHLAVVTVTPVVIGLVGVAIRTYQRRRVGSAAA